MNGHDVKLGSFILPGAERDAVHIAIAPVIAGEKLSPGQHVGFIAADTVGTENAPIGIIDPFLRGDIAIGARCWLFLYPGTITSLRHDWTHPAFLQTPKASSEAWMRKWATEHMGDDYYGDEGGKVSDDQAYAYAIYAGRRMNVGCYEHARDYIDNEWWAHWEAITGEAGKRGEYFSCAC